MTRFLARRLLNYVVLLVLASFLTFALTSWSFKPLDSLEARNPRPPQAVIDAKAAELNLDKPIPDAVRPLGVRRRAAATSAPRSPASRSPTSCGGASASACDWCVIGSVLGTLIGVVVGAWGAIRQYHLVRPRHHGGRRCC